MFKKFFITLCLVLVLLQPTLGRATRLFTCGFEENNLEQTIWTSNAGSAAVTIGSTSPHSGTYRMNTAGTAATSYLQKTVASTAPTSGTLFWRFYMSTSNAAPGVDTLIFLDRSSTSVTTMSLTFLGTGALRLTNALTPASVDTTATLSANTWYRIELRHIISDTAGEMKLQLYDNAGALIEEQTNTEVDTKSTDVSIFRLGKQSSNAFTLSFDDVAMNNALGTFQTSYPGAGKTYMLVPDSEVTMTWEDDGTGTDINDATAANIDDLPGTPDDTNYNKQGFSLNVSDRLGLTNLGAEVTSDATIAVASVYARVGSTQTSSTLMRMKLWDEAGTLTDGPNVLANVNGFRIIHSAETLSYDATGKTKANFDSFNVGYEAITDTIARERRISAAWVNVDWIEAAPAGGGGTGHNAMLLGVGP